MTADRRRVIGAIAVAVVAVATSAGGLYVQLSRRANTGSAGSTVSMVVPSPAPAASASAATASRAAAPTIEASSERLARRLKEKDGSAEDWALLARSYVQMGRHAEAVEAFARALEKMPGNAAFVAEQAAARKAAAEGPAPR